MRGVFRAVALPAVAFARRAHCVLSLPPSLSLVRIFVLNLQIRPGRVLLKFPTQVVALPLAGSRVCEIRLLLSLSFSVILGIRKFESVRARARARACRAKTLDRDTSIDIRESHRSRLGNRDFWRERDAGHEPTDRPSHPSRWAQRPVSIRVCVVFHSYLGLEFPVSDSVPIDTCSGTRRDRANTFELSIVTRATPVYKHSVKIQVVPGWAKAAPRRKLLGARMRKRRGRAASSSPLFIRSRDSRGERLRERGSARGARARFFLRRDPKSNKRRSFSESTPGKTRRRYWDGHCAQLEQHEAVPKSTRKTTALSERRRTAALSSAPSNRVRIVLTRSCAERKRER